MLKKATVFNPSKSHRVFLLAEVLQPYYGSHGQHNFKELQELPRLLSNECLLRLYQLTVESLNAHSIANAIFFCDKLVTLSNGSTPFVYLLGQCYFRNADFPKVHALFEKHHLLTVEVSFQLLAARALLCNKQYDQCIAVLDMQPDRPSLNRKTNSLRSFLRAQCYDAQENKQMAIQAYTDALQKDPTNVEAFTRLVDYQLISAAQRDKLIGSLLFQSDDWLRKLYELKARVNDDDAATRGMEEDVRRDNMFDLLVQKDNISVLCARAKSLHQNYQIPAAYQECLKAIAKDPLCFQVLPVYASCLLELNLTGKLYYCAHSLAQNYTGHPVSWFAVGTYYFHSRKFEVARKYFQKAIILDKSCVWAWVAMGHSFAVQDESEQAMNIYRTVARLFPGCWQAHLYMGMEYLRTNSLKTATLALQRARDIAPHDPLVQSELGVIQYKLRNYKEARRLLTDAHALCHPEASPWLTESVLTNLAHACRKLRMYKPAVAHLDACLSLHAANPHTCFSLAFLYHLTGQLCKAISFYHKTLKLKHDNLFAQEMLQKALTDAADMPWETMFNS